MFTVCPKCALTLVVTAADLRVAQGYVRCGRCLNVFNALARLSEERPGAAPPQEAAALGESTSVEESTPTEESTSVEEPTPVEEPAPVHAVQPDTSRQPPLPSFTDDADTGEIEVELDASILVTSVRGPTALESLEETGELEAEEISPAPGGITPAHTAAAPPHAAEPPSHTAAAPPHAAESPAHTAAAPPPQATTTPPQPAAAPAQVTPASAQSAVAPAAAAAARSAAAGLASIAQPRAEPTSVAAGPHTQASRNTALVSESTESALSRDAGDGTQTNTVHQEADAAIELTTQPPRAGLAWKIGAGALVALLALQIVNHYRDVLASDPSVGRPLSSIYSALGVKLAPRWNIHAYDVRQLGASAADAADGQIVVRASVKNTASRAQPLPLLRVTLQDRFGNRIAARDVPPSDYLPSSVARTSLLAAGSRVDATMVFVDPGPQAVGFEIDACLQRQGGEVACAHGP